MKKILMIVAAGIISLPIFAQTPDSNEIVRRAEVMPVFQTCEDERYAEHPHRCSITQLIQHFDNSINISNPTGEKTKAHLKFVVEKDGSVSNVDLVRGVVVASEEVSLELNQGIVNVANALSFQSPGINEGEPVRVQIEFSVSLNY